MAVKTKPIEEVSSLKCQVLSWRSRWSELQTSHFTLPTRPKAARAKQSQFQPEGKLWQVLHGKRVMMNGACEGVRRNKANWRRDQVSGIGGRRPDTRYLTPGPACETKPISPSAGGAVAGRNCAKPSQFPPPCRCGDRRSRGQACETKPIRVGIRFQGSGVSDLTSDTRPLTPARLCETKPISGRGQATASALRKKGYDGWDPQKRSAKQSQFPPVGPTRQVQNPPQAHHTPTPERLVS